MTEIQNTAGRMIKTCINGENYTPFAGAKKYNRNSKVTNLSDALIRCGLRDGFTISFHHQLRNGDRVLNMTLEAIQNLNVKNVRLAQNALFA